MAFNPDFGLNMLQRQAAERAIKNGTNLPPQMTGDGTGVSDMDLSFMAAVRQDLMGQGSEAQPQAAPEAPQNPATAALMSGAADASRVAAMAHGGAVKGYAEGGRTFLSDLLDPTKIDYEEEDRKLEEYQTKGEGKDRTPFVKDLFRLAQKTDPFRFTSSISKATEPYARNTINYFTGKRFEGDPENALFEYERKPFVPLEAASIPKYNFNKEPVAPAEINAPRAANAAAAAENLTNLSPAAVEPGKPDPAAEAMNARKQAESDAHKERMDKFLSDDQPLSAQDKWMALARAGFAAAAGSSPNALQNIGAGLGKGIESLDELRKERAVNRMKQATLLQSQRSEDLSNDARDRQLKVSERGVEIQGARELREAEAERLAAPGKTALITAQTAALNRPDKASAIQEEISIQNKIDAMPDGKDKDRAQTVFDRFRTNVTQTPLFSIQQAILNAGTEAVKLFNQSLGTLDKDDPNPTKRAAIDKRRQEVKVAAERDAAVRFGVTSPSTAAPPPAGGGWSATEVK